jgi:hypothetical protein
MLATMAWYKEFYEPEYTEADVARDAQELIVRGFASGEVMAGIRRYRDTYVYGRTRNWAHLLHCIMEVRKQVLNLMPPGLAADSFFKVMAIGWVQAKNSKPDIFVDKVKAEGFGAATADYMCQAHRIVGDSIRYQDLQYAKPRYMSAYADAVSTGMDQPPLAISSGETKSVKQLLEEGGLYDNLNEQTALDAGADSE